MQNIEKDRKSKILVVHNYYQIPGGEDTVVENEVKLLKENGHKVILYNRNNNEIKNFSMIKKILLPFMMIFNLRTYREIRKIIKEENIDIVHVHNTLNLVSPAVYYAALSLKVPVIQTIHNFRLLCPSGTFYRDGHICEDCVAKGMRCSIKHGCYRESKLQTLIYVFNLKIHQFLGVYGKINYIALTEFNKEKLLNFKQIEDKRIFIKPNFSENSINMVPYEQRDDYFVFVGRIDKLKGIEMLLQAWKTMGKEALELIICGTGPEEEWCKKYIEENELLKIKMMGFLSIREVNKMIAYSKALILPTQWYEGFPMVIVEAYSNGTPVIGSNLGNTGNIIKENKTGLKFSANSLKELSECIEKIKQNNTICDSVIQEYRENYTKEKNYEILKAIYDKVYEDNKKY